MKKRILSFALLIIIILSISVPVIADNGSTIVYIADSGTKYHRASCRYLDNSSHAVTLEAAALLGKSPCAVCNPPRLSSSPSNSNVGVRAATEDNGTPAYVIVIVLIIGFFVVRSMFRKSQSPAQTSVQHKEELSKVQQVPIQTATEQKNKVQSTAVQKPLPSVSKPAPAKLDTPSRRYLVGNVYYCWDYYYGDVFSARILNTSQSGAEIEINGTIKTVSYADLDRRFFPHPEDIPEYRSIKRPHPYQIIAKEGTVKERQEELITAPKTSIRTQKESFQKQGDASQALGKKQTKPTQSAAVSFEKSCNNCRLRKGGQCSQVRNILCDDYIALPDVEPEIGEKRAAQTLPQSKNATGDDSSYNQIRQEQQSTSSSSSANMTLQEVNDKKRLRDASLPQAEIARRNTLRERIRKTQVFSEKFGSARVICFTIDSSGNEYFIARMADNSIKKFSFPVAFDTGLFKTNDVKKSIADERQEAYRYLVEERDVQYLMHFTPVENIQSILDNGIIPRYYLMRDRKNVVVTDEKRLDDRPDCTSFSISFPNYRMMFKKHNNFRFALIFVDPAVLLDMSIDQIYYLPDNAARMSKYGIDNLKGLDALKDLFSTPVKTNIGMKTREELDIPECFPSNPQAEVFIRGTVKPKYIKAVVVDDPFYAKALRNKLRLPPDWDESMVGHSISYFKPRVDSKYWQ